MCLAAVHMRCSWFPWCCEIGQLASPPFGNGGRPWRMYRGRCATSSSASMRGDTARVKDIPLELRQEVRQAMRHLDCSAVEPRTSDHEREFVVG